MKKYSFAIALVLFSLLFIIPPKVLAASPTGYLNILDNGLITGWANDPDNTSQPIDIHIYLDGIYGVGTMIGYTKANLPKYNGNWGFEFSAPQILDGKPHEIFAYGIDLTGDAPALLIGSPQSYPIQVTHAYYQSPNFPDSTGLFADDKNYFNEWACTSPTGIDTIRKLDIAPLGKHYSYFWKDSTYVNDADTHDGYPVVYFTGSLNPSGPKFALKKASYNASLNKWEIFDVLNHPNPRNGGFSSQDGTADDYIMNEYNIPGLGPTANKPGSQSKIPGVSEAPTATGVQSYPLVGTGPLGLTTISTFKQNDLPWPGSNTCLFANPTLYDYDANGIPHSFATTLANFGNLASPQPCNLPPGAPVATLPGVAIYFFHYIDATLGWQLDLNTPPINTLSAASHIFSTKNTLISASWDLVVKSYDLSKPSDSREKTLLDCSKGPYKGGEGTGNENNIFFIATTQPDGTAVGLAENTPIHDIFYAYNDPNINAFNLADLNKDGKVDINDYNLLKNNFGKTGVGDVNGNGKVDIFDYNTLISNYGK